MLLVLIVFVIVCFALDVYAFCRLRKCDKNVRYVQKLPHRVIGKVQLEQKINEIGAFLGFGFFIAFSVLFMWFWALKTFVESYIWSGIITTGLVLDAVFFGILFLWNIDMYQKIDRL